MSFATDMQAVASELLTEFGRAVTFSRTVEGDYIPATSDVGPGVTTIYSGYGHPAPYTAAEIATGTVSATDIQLLTYTTTVPLVGDTVSVNGAVHRVMNVNRVSAQGSDIVYKLQLRI